MSQPQDKTSRLAAALKANLARRKAQSRARRDAADADHGAVRDATGAAREGGISGGPGESPIVPDGKAR
ncbi:hypothetical protein [Xanthobacter agilis]|uniref:hypothetical protein n=1 Tax=Xanthobacter agilis TaxID=47492 RepID=UPI0037293128